jgi:ribosomal protein S18 acetylase RimI-like enzyme
MQIAIRPIIATDAAVVAAMHTASWRDAYRGILSDEYLANAVVPDRIAVWNELLANVVPSRFGFIAEVDDEPGGFVFLRVAHDPTWGTLVDNLHVLPGLRGHGVGRTLVAAAAEEALIRHPNARVHLWVFEQNVRARSFYARLGGQEVERVVAEPPGGGSRAEWRVYWNNPEHLLANVARGAAADSGGPRPSVRYSD